MKTWKSHMGMKKQFRSRKGSYFFLIEISTQKILFNFLRREGNSKLDRGKLYRSSTESISVERFGKKWKETGERLRENIFFFTKAQTLNVTQELQFAIEISKLGAAQLHQNSF